MSSTRRRLGALLGTAVAAAAVLTVAFVALGPGVSEGAPTLDKIARRFHRCSPLPADLAFSPAVSDDGAVARVRRRPARGGLDGVRSARCRSPSRRWRARRSTAWCGRGPRRPSPLTGAWSPSGVRRRTTGRRWPRRLRPPRAHPVEHAGGVRATLYRVEPSARAPGRRWLTLPVNGGLTTASSVHPTSTVEPTDRSLPTACAPSAIRRPPGTSAYIERPDRDTDRPQRRNDDRRRSRPWTLTDGRADPGVRRRPLIPQRRRPTSIVLPAGRSSRSASVPPADGSTILGDAQPRRPTARPWPSWPDGRGADNLATVRVLSLDPDDHAGAGSPGR